jgi:hypothetical protein
VFSYIHTDLVVLVLHPRLSELGELWENFLNGTREVFELGCDDKQAKRVRLNVAVDCACRSSKWYSVVLVQNLLHPAESKSLHNCELHLEDFMLYPPSSYRICFRALAKPSSPNLV